MVSIPPRTATYSPMIGCVIVKQVKTSNMKISEVIKKLQDIQEEHGDLEVKAYDAIYFPVDEDTFLVHNNELLIRG